MITASFFDRSIRVVCVVWFTSFLLPCDTAVAQGDVATTSGSKVAQVNDPESFSVMTWNLEWFYDENPEDNYSKLSKEKSAPSRSDWDWHRDAIAKSINDAKPTVLAMQEVENRRVMWYLSRALDRNHKIDYTALCNESRDVFTEQDVALMYRQPADALSATSFRMTREMKKSQNFYDVSKHIMGVFQVPNGTDTPERVVVMNIHWRSRADGESLRRRQARLSHLWLRERISKGENVILLGDTNTEEKSDTTRPDSDLGIACGAETESTNDDLVDLNLNLTKQQRRTHLLPDRQFDRIMVSRSLLEDDPRRPDLVFSRIEVLRDLAVKGELDTETEHWTNYWNRPESERDLSDHLPVMATFEIK